MTQLQSNLSLSETFVVRVAGLPLDLLHQLRFNRTAAVIEEVTMLDRWLQEQAQPLSDALYPVIGALTDKVLSARMIALRRAVFQAQLPKRAIPDAQVWAALPTDLASRLTIWIERIERKQSLLERGAAILDAEWADKRGALHELAKAEPLQQGLLLASIDLYRELRTWLRAGLEAPVRANRKLELSLMLYLSRTAAKTSPYSTFTSIGAGRWTKDGPVVAQAASGWQRQSASELNSWVITQLVGALSRWPEIRPTLLLRVNSSLSEAGGYLRFLTWRHHETVQRIAISPTLQHILSVVRTLDPPTYGAVLQAMSPDATSERHAAAARFLDQLVTLGLLNIDWNIPEQSVHYLEQLLERLREFNTPASVGLQRLLGDLQMNLTRYAAAQRAAERYDLLTLIAATLNHISEQSSPQLGIALPAKHTFYEDTLVTGLDVRWSQAAWHETLNDLGLLQHLVQLYDPCISSRLAACVLFTQHYGAGASVSLLDFFEAMCQGASQTARWQITHRVRGFELARQTAPPAARDTAQFVELVRLQQELPDWTIRQPVEVGVRHLDRTMLADLIARFPSFIAPPTALAFYCQVLLKENVPHLVLNALQNGSGRRLGRLQRLEARMGIDRAPHQPRAAANPSGPVYADLAGVFTSNVNLRRVQHQYEIVYPGYISHRPLAEQITLAELRVMHDPQADRLRLFSARLDREVVPEHLGMMGELWLPPFYRFLLQVFGQGSFDPAAFSIYALTNVESSAAPVRYYPRICLGNLVVERAIWVTHVSRIPARDKGETGFAYLLKMQRWRNEHGIPSPCFVRSIGSGKYRKPLYLDFDNYLTVLTLERAMNKAGTTVIFQEALPGAEDLVLRDGALSYVSEYVIELAPSGEAL